MKNLLKCAIAGGLVAFLWTNISWMVLPWHWTAIGGVQNEAQVSQALKAGTNGNGVYILPYSADHSGEAQAEVHKKMAKGPYAFMVVRPEGLNLSMSRMMIVGLLTNILVAFLLTYLLKRTNGLTFIQRAGHVSLSALCGASFVLIADLNWWHFPMSYSLVNLADTGITWFLAGLVISKLESN